MSALRKIQVPHLIRLKSGALKRLPIYLERENLTRVLLLKSEGLPEGLWDSLPPVSRLEDVLENSIEWLTARLPGWQDKFDVVVGLGGGKALDVAKVAAYRLGLPYFAVPTSLSNDGFCSPRSSLTQAGKRLSVPARLPMAVVVDLDVVLGAPLPLWLSGVGDLVAKWTALYDWKLAFHKSGVPYDDLAALLSDGTVFQFMAHPRRDAQGIRLLAQALLLNGVAMEMAGCSRPASGSEHLISHALDQISRHPKLHGLQVGLASYWMALVQWQDVSRLDDLFEVTGFWDHWRTYPASLGEWSEALKIAPTLKKDFPTVLDDPERLREAERLLRSNPRLRESLKDE